jgi:hypothetical protein
MAEQIVILNESYINIDDSFHINWTDKGNAMPSLSNTIHAVIWNNLGGQNEIQSKDASTQNMTGNTDLSATSDAVGSTTIENLLTWGETRKGEITTATASYDAVVDDDIANGTNNAAGKTWRDYDPNYS